LLSISNAASRKAQDAIRARLKKNLAESPPDFFWIFCGAALFAPEMLFAVWRKHARLQE
jgi:hypothetical protein